MEQNHKKIVESITTLLLQSWNKEVLSASDEMEYCAGVTAALVFQKLIKNAFMNNAKLSVGHPSEADDIFNLLEEHAKAISDQIINSQISN